MSTLGFERDPRERDAVLRPVARLPGSIEPARDLWPPIEAKIRARKQPAPLPRRTLSWQWALAACTAIASVSVLFTWLALRNPEAGAPVVPLQPAPPRARWRATRRRAARSTAGGP